MSESASPAARPQTSTLPVANPAVQRCIDAWNRIYQPLLAKGKLEFVACQAAGPAFRAAMPELTSPANIRDFIACTARGILLGAIEEKQGSRLLYAAQVASSALQRIGTVKEPAPIPAQAQSVAA